MSKDDLKPCPFCGGSARYDNADCGPWEWVECRECGAKGPEVNYNRRDECSAVAAWNARDQPAQTSAVSTPASHPGASS